MGPRKVAILLVLLSVTWGKADGRTSAPLANNEMAIEIYDGYLAVAQGSANGITNLRFLLDTGATDTAIDRSLAEKLGLQSKPTEVTSFDKTVKSKWTGLREITFGPERASSVRVMIEDLSYFGWIGVRIDGVIGLDLLMRQSFAVNYAQKTVLFAPVATIGMRSAPMLADDTAIRVKAELDGHPVWMVADTGAPAPVLYEDTLKKLAVSYRLERHKDWLTPTGHVESRIAVVPRFRVGGLDLGREVVLVSVPESKRVRGVSGYLGVASLQATELAFDFEKHQFLWKK